MDAAERGFVLDQWYVAGWSDEVGAGKLTGRMVLGRPAALFRRADGSVAALENICPHRWAPLTMGTVVGDEVECGYHGHRFDGEGRCTLVPSQPEQPSRARVRAYPVIERGPLIWIWTGDPSKADTSLVPATPELADPAYVWAVVTMDIEAHYLLMHENTLDQTHFHTLHKTFAAAADWDRGEITLETVGGKVIRTHATTDAPAPAVAAFCGVEPGTRVDSVSVGTFVQPGLNTSVTTHTVRGEGRSGVLMTYHIFLPQAENSTRYSIAVGTPHEGADLEKLRAGVYNATLEDKVAVEAIHRVSVEYAPGVEFSVRSDQAGLQARALVRERLSRQALEQQGA